MESTRGPELRALLERTKVFGHLTSPELDALLDEMAWLWLPAGGPLYLRGEESDALYLLKSGSLGVFGIPLGGGPSRLLGVISAGATLGEVGLITGEMRSHEVRALRDSEVLRLSREGFEKLVARHPQAMLGAARVAIQRLSRGEPGDATDIPRTFAILPLHDGLDAHAFAARLQQQLQVWGGCAMIDARLGRAHDTDWFAAREAESRFVLYLGDADATWQRLCRRQADALLWLADADREPRAVPHGDDGDALRHPADRVHGPAMTTDQTHQRPRHLVLRQPANRFIHGAARAWRAALGPGSLRSHHWRNAGDIARIARLLSGHSTGLVLSGGGARGFAQIGVIQALREADIVIDSVVGTSIGAIIGAGIAHEWDDATLRAACRRAMVDGKPLSDWTLPVVALTRGARTTRLLREAFGEIEIEDLPIPFACVSADLTLGTLAVHREGLLWRWLRASSAVPGVLPPVFHRGHVHVDGGVINNLPYDVLATEAHGRVIAVDIGADYTVTAEVDEAVLPRLPALWLERRRHRRRPGMFAILLRAAMVNSETGSAQRRGMADLLLRPDMHEIGLFDWRQFDHAIEIGYRYTREVLRKAGGAAPSAGATD